MSPANFFWSKRWLTLLDHLIEILKPLDPIVLEPQGFLFYLGKIFNNEVSNCISNLPKKTSSGDDISCNFIIKVLIICIAPVITELLNVSFA